jgi:CubicO group peptidase (beta-lactamase class C family)
MDSPLAAFLRGRVAAGIFPGARYRVARGPEILEEGWLGHAVLTPERIETGEDTIYDLASLTKPLVTGTLAVLFAGRGILDLQEPAGRLLPELRGRWLAEVRLVDLLAHRSGLPAWLPVYLHASGREGYLGHLASLPREYATGTRVTYSCLGYILLALVLERAGGATLDVLAEREILSRAALARTGYRPPADLRPRIAATEEGNGREREMAGEAGKGFGGWRSGVIWGECHDLNAWHLGGVAGNAGLFSSASDLHKLSLEFLGEGSGLFSERDREAFRTDLTPGLNENRSAGWQLASTPGCSAGPLLSQKAFGHTGFTGTSLWIDPENRSIFLLLTNRVHPRYRPDDMNAVRREFHRWALTAAAGRA